MLTQVPRFGLTRGNFRTRQTILLPGTIADNLSIKGKTHRIGLRVLQSNSRQEHIALCFGRDLFILCHNIR